MPVERWELELTNKRPADASVLAVVIDTCAFPYGNFDVDKVAGLARRLEARGVELWIPIQIIYELAAHADRAFAKLRSAYKPLKKTGLVAELRQITAPEIADTFRSVCEDIDNVHVIEMNGDCAIEAIKDQILGTGPGTVKGSEEIRTGATDSSWVRDAFRHSDSDVSSLLFLSANRRDIVATATELGYGESNIFSSGREDELFSDFLPPDSSLDPVGVLGFIADRLLGDIGDAAAADDRHGPPPAWIEVSDISVASLTWEDREALEKYVDDVTVDLEPCPTLVEVFDISIDAKGGRVEVSYTVLLHGDLAVEGLIIDNDGNAVPDWDTLGDKLIAVPYVAEVQKEHLGVPRQTDSAIAREPRQGFDDSYDAYSWLYHEISQWVGVTVEAVGNADDELPLQFRLTGPRGRTEEAVVQEDSITDGWTLQFEKASVSLVSSYDPNSRAWLGGDDSYDVYPPVSIHSETASGRMMAATPYAALGAVWVRHERGKESYVGRSS